MSARTTVVIVTYRSKGVVDRALDGLAPLAGSGEVHCVVVDNASDDGTAEHIKQHFSWVQLVAGPTNLGFGRGCNAGLAHADTEFVLFLNPDALIDGDSIEILEHFFDHRAEAGLIAPAVECEGQIEPVWTLPTPCSVVAVEAGLVSPEARRVQLGAEPFETNWLSGAVLMGRRALLEELDGFDPAFFLYFEETDLCARARQRGAELWLVPTALARHVGGASVLRTDARLWAGCIAKHYFESRHYYFTKHFGLLPACAATLLELAVIAARGFRDVLRGRGARRLRYRLGAPLLRRPTGVG